MLKKSSISIPFQQPINVSLLFPVNLLLKFPFFHIPHSLGFCPPKSLCKPRVHNLASNHCKMIQSIPLFRLKVPKAICIPSLQMIFEIFKFIFKEKHSRSIRRTTLSPPLSHQIIQGQVSEPHKLKSKRRVLRNCSRRRRELNRPMIRTPPIKNFITHNQAASNPITRNKKLIQMF